MNASVAEFGAASNFCSPCWMALLPSSSKTLAVAATVAAPRTRRLGAGLAAVLFVAVFPANVKMAIDWSDRSLWERVAAYGRLPLQIPMVLWALRVRSRP